MGKPPSVPTAHRPWLGENLRRPFAALGWSKHTYRLKAFAANSVIPPIHGRLQARRATVDTCGSTVWRRWRVCRGKRRPGPWPPPLPQDSDAPELLSDSKANPPHTSTPAVGELNTSNTACLSFAVRSCAPELPVNRAGRACHGFLCHIYHQARPNGPGKEAQPAFVMIQHRTLQPTNPLGAGATRQTQKCPTMVAVNPFRRNIDCHLAALVLCSSRLFLVCPPAAREYVKLTN
ncbi:unnamed protein product [Periconia digitata]|uniref:Uncharacterized protein n=1 Tax=Periconia digitata TaxID=1303443 RepID=A0A9W4U1Z8_9PLEO|nr:unnamed protein product [Periconia digitata]